VVEVVAEVVADVDAYLGVPGCSMAQWCSGASSMAQFVEKKRQETRDKRKGKRFEVSSDQPARGGRGVAKRSSGDTLKIGHQSSKGLFYQSGVGRGGGGEGIDTCRCCLNFRPW
jgi:hypothetical protein